MSQFFIDSNSVPGGSINTLSSEGGPATPPNGTNFNFSGSVAGGSAANGAIEFITPGGPGAATNGQMDAVVQVDNTTITINGSNQLQALAGFTWVVQTVDLTAVKGFGYFANSAAIGPGALQVTLPVTSAVGDTFKVYAFNSNGFTIRQNAGQFIQMMATTTTVGVGGSVVTVDTGSSIELVCSVANTQWEAVSFAGNVNPI